MHKEIDFDNDVEHALIYSSNKRRLQGNGLRAAIKAGRGKVTE